MLEKLKFKLTKVCASSCSTKDKLVLDAEWRLSPGIENQAADPSIRSYLARRQNTHKTSNARDIGALVATTKIGSITVKYNQSHEQ